MDMKNIYSGIGSKFVKKMHKSNNITFLIQELSVKGRHTFIQNLENKIGDEKLLKLDYHSYHFSLTHSRNLILEELLDSDQKIIKKLEQFKYFSIIDSEDQVYLKKLWCTKHSRKKFFITSFPKLVVDITFPYTRNEKAKFYGYFFLDGFDRGMFELRWG